MKRIIIILLSLLSMTSSFAQVQNTFFNGAILGKSDMQTTYSIMANYFGEVPSNFFGILSMKEPIYAQYKWDAINAHFHNGKFAQVNLRYFTDGYAKRSSDNIYHRYLSLKQSLDNKYKGRVKAYKLPENPGEEGFYYYDGRYAVSLTLIYRIAKNQKVYTETQLWYWDAKLMNESEKPQINNDL